jgi:hypothetical protein
VPVAEVVFSVRGVRELDARSADWKAEKFLDWLVGGFECLADATQSNEWSFAFTPLVLRMDSDPVSQFSAALAEAKRAGLAVAAKLKRAVVEYLDRLPMSGRGDIELVGNLWGCLAALEAAGQEAGLARRILKRIPEERLTDSSDAIRRLVTLMSASILSSATPASQHLSFFQFVRARPALWDDRLVVPLIHGQLIGDQAQLQEAWTDLRYNFGNELRRIADPKTPTGRALSRVLARRLRPDQNTEGSPRNIQEMARLLNEIGVNSAPPASNPAEVSVLRSRNIEDSPMYLQLVAVAESE